MADHRMYRRITLMNGLDVLLIHDEETKKASTAVDVNVGSFMDPSGMPGLAHAVEHMLFMGSEKVDVQPKPVLIILKANLKGYSTQRKTTSKIIPLCMMEIQTH